MIVRLTDITRKNDKNITNAITEAADKIADAGGSPRAQIDAARAVSSNRLTYNAHIGEKQTERNRQRLAKKFLPCPICFGVEGCDHTIQERKEKW